MKSLSSVFTTSSQYGSRIDDVMWCSSFPSFPDLAPSLLASVSPHNPLPALWLRACSLWGVCKQASSTSRSSVYIHLPLGCMQTALACLGLPTLADDHSLNTVISLLTRDPSYGFTPYLRYFSKFTSPARSPLPLRTLQCQDCSICLLQMWMILVFLL